METMAQFNARHPAADYVLTGQGKNIYLSYAHKGVRRTEKFNNNKPYLKV